MLACLCLAGSITTALSPSRGGMVAGRLLYGLGSGSLSVAITIGIAKWFQGMNVSFVYGIYLTLCRLGSLAAQTSPVWARAAYGWWRTPLLLAILAGLVGLLAAMAYWVLEVRLGRRYRLGPQATRGRVLTGDLLRFSPSYWLVVLLCVTFYAGIYPFQTFAQKFFVEAQGASPYRASLLVGTPTVIAMVASPLFGLLADRIGRRSLLMLLGTALLVPIYLLMGYGHINLFIPMTLMGVAFSLVPAVMWPAVILTAPAEKLGTAFGLMSLIQSVGLGGFNLVIGWANVAGHAGQANPAGYRLGMGLFTASVLLGLGFAVLLWRRERGPAGHGLESPSGSRRVVRPA
jgi:MFS family permease